MSLPAPPPARNLALMFGIALVLRLAFAAAFHEGQILQPGTLVRHVSIARSLMAGHGLQQEQRTPPNATRPQDGEVTLNDPGVWGPLDPTNLDRPTISDSVGYGVLLAAVWTLTGASFLPVILLQALLDALCAPALAGIATTLSGDKRLGRATGWTYALLPPLARVAVNPHRDAWALFGMVLGLWFLLRHVRKDKGSPLFSPALLGATLCVAVGTWLRPPMLALAVVTPLLLLAHPDLPRRRVLAGGLAFFVGALLFVGPFMAYNQRVWGKPWMMVSGLGQWESYGEFPNPYGNANSDVAAGAYVASQPNPPPSLTPAWDAVLLRRVHEIDAADPTLKHRNALKRLPQLFASGFADVVAVPPEARMSVWMATPGHTRLGYLRAYPLLSLVRFCLSPPFWVLVFTGVWLLRRSWRRLLVFAAAPAYSTLYCAYSHFENRIIVVGLWGAALFFAAALLAASDFWRARRRAA